MDNTFYRFYYMRKNIISFPIILFVLFLTVIVIAFTWVILFISILTFLITILLFIKFGVPLINEKIIIHVDGKVDSQRKTNGIISLGRYCGYSRN